MQSREEFGEVFAKGDNVIVPSEEQWAAITAPLEPCIIIAGAGTGKTTTMACRISYLIGTGQVLPEKILGLTFTKKAARELAQAVQSRSQQALKYREEIFPKENDESDFGEPTISTYNSFGARLLKEHGLRIGIEPDARVLVDATRHQLAFRVVASTKVAIKGDDFFGINDVVEKMLKLDDECANYLVSPDEVIESDLKIISKFDGLADAIDETHKMVEVSKKRIILAQLVAEFRQAKIDSGIIDYSDQIRLAAEAAMNSAEMCQMLREQYDVVLLDEYQDTSVSQKMLLQRLFGGGHPVMAVGDPCQAIYGWRAADVINIDKFTGEFKRSDGSAAIEYSLTRNRRSGQNILNSANALSASLRAQHPNIKELVAGDPSKPPGEIFTAVLSSAQQEVEWICDQIEQQIAGKYRPKEVAVLVRANKFAPAYVAGLEAREIPVQVADPGVLIHLPEIRDVLSYLELMVNPTANTALVRLLAGPRWRIGPRDLAVLGKHAGVLAKSDYQAEKHLPMDVQLDRAVGSTDVADQVCLMDALEEVSDESFPYSPEARERMSELASQLRHLRKFSGDSAIDAITRIIRESGIGIEALAKPEKISKAHSDRLGALIDLAGAYRSLDSESGIHAFLRFLADGERFDNLPQSELTDAEDAVIVMSAHKSKGLEFPVVAVPVLSKDQFPKRGSVLQWFANPQVLPTELKKKDIQDVRVMSLHLAHNPDKKVFSDYREYFTEIYEFDERRLGYVAATRAQDVLITSCSWWGPTQLRPWGPSVFHSAIAEHATQTFDETVLPQKGEKNPHLSGTEVQMWPHPISSEHFEAVSAQAELVRSAQRKAFPEQLTSEEQAIVANWDTDIEALLGLLDRLSNVHRQVKLPDSLTASQVVSLQKDEQAFIQTLIRPMPRKPAPEAVRGINFHAWVEDYYGKRSLANMVDQLNGSDSPIYDDEMLASLKQAFLDGVFAHRAPFDFETPFSLVVGGRPIIGRIDAVFAGTVEDPSAKERWTVVDWKTGAPGSSDPIQLHIYRAAWAQLMQVPLESVDAAFYYVGHKVLEPLDAVMTIDDIGKLI